MTTLLKPSDGARKALEAVGLSMGDLRAMAAQEPDGLVQVMRLLDSTFGENEEALAQIIPNVRAFRGVMNVLAQDSTIVDSVLRGVTESTGSLDHAFATASETIKFKWDAAIAKVQSSAITLGNAVQKSAIPVIEAFTDKLQELTKWFTNLTDEQQQNIIKWAGLTAAIFPVIMITGTLIKSMGAILTLFGILGKGILGTTTLFAGLGTTVTATGTAAAGAGVAAGGAAVGIAGIGAAALAAAPLLIGLAVVLGGVILWWKRYTEFRDADMRTFEQVAAESFKGTLKAFVEGQLAILDSESAFQIESLKGQIAYLDEKGDLSEEEIDQRKELNNQLLEEERIAAEKRKGLMLINEREMLDALVDITGTSNEAVVDKVMERKGMLVDAVNEETLAILDAILDRHAKEGTIGSKAFLDEIDAAEAQGAQRLNQVHVQLGAELKAEEDAMFERGQVYDVGLGDIITISEAKHRELAGQVSRDFHALGIQYGQAALANVAAYTGGIVTGMPAAVGAAGNMGAQGLAALKRGSLGGYEIGKTMGTDTGRGIKTETGPVEAAAYDMGRRARGALERGSAGAYEIGAAIGDKMAAGINDKVIAVAEKAAYMAWNAMRAAQAEITKWAKPVDAGGTIPIGSTAGLSAAPGGGAYSGSGVPSGTAPSGTGGGTGGGSGAKVVSITPDTPAQRMHDWLVSVGINPGSMRSGSAPSTPAPSGGISDTGNWWDLGFDSGGVVPGLRGAPQLAVVHGGETILPTHKTGMSNTRNFSIDMRGLFDGATVNMRSDAQAKTLARELWTLTQNRARAEGVML